MPGLVCGAGVLRRLQGRRVQAGPRGPVAVSATAAGRDCRCQGDSPINARRLKVLIHPAPLVVDEIGYLPVSQDGAVLFLQLINARHERASTVLTSNKGFEEWGGVLGDKVMVMALIDQPAHHCHIVNIRGNNYRMREHRDLLGTTGPDRNAQQGSAA